MATAVWPLRLFIPMVHQFQCSNTIIPLGDGNELRMNKDQDNLHANGQGGVTNHRGRWGFQINLAAIDHSSSDMTKEVNQLWTFISARLANWEPFYFYNPIENPTIDLTGTDTLGRYLVRLVESSVTLEDFVLRLHHGTIQLIEVRG